MGPQLVANLGYAALAGIAGAIVIGILGYIFKIFGIRLDFPFIVGSFFTKPGETGKSYIIGIIVHLVIGAIFALLFIIVFMGMNIVPSWEMGLLFGLGNGLLSGVAFGTLGEDHPLMGEGKKIPDPGVFLTKWGLPTTVIFVGLHMLFGVVVVLLYTHMFSSSLVTTMVGHKLLTY